MIRVFGLNNAALQVFPYATTNPLKDLEPTAITA